MSEQVLIAVIGGVFAVIVALLSYIGNLQGARKANAANMTLFEYRLKQLEDKMDKHNNFIERLTIAETAIKDLQKEK